MVGESFQQGQRAAAQAFPLYLQPVLKFRAIGQGQTRQEFASVQAQHALIAVLSRFGEVEHIDIGMRGEADALAAGGKQPVATGLLQRPTQVREGAAQVATCRQRVGTTPQQIGQHFPLVLPVALHRQVGQQGAHPGVRQTDHRLPIAPYLHVAQQQDLKAGVWDGDGSHSGLANGG